MCPTQPLTAALLSESLLLFISAVFFSHGWVWATHCLLLADGSAMKLRSLVRAHFVVSTLTSY